MPNFYKKMRIYNVHEHVHLYKVSKCSDGWLASLCLCYMIVTGCLLVVAQLSRQFREDTDCICVEPEWFHRHLHCRTRNWLAGRADSSATRIPPVCCRRPLPARGRGEKGALVWWGTLGGIEHPRNRDGLKEREGGRCSRVSLCLTQYNITSEYSYIHTCTCIYKLWAEHVQVHVATRVHLVIPQRKRVRREGKREREREKKGRRQRGREKWRAWTEARRQ